MVGSIESVGGMLIFASCYHMLFSCQMCDLLYQTVENFIPITHSEAKILGQRTNRQSFYVICHVAELELPPSWTSCGVRVRKGFAT